MCISVLLLGKRLKEAYLKAWSLLTNLKTVLDTCSLLYLCF